ncbi:hypothetical protein ACFE04_012577 [Oxalis oulophora]
MANFHDIDMKFSECPSSGKCQILHWRQGHKEECHPPSDTHGRNDDGSVFTVDAQRERYKVLNDSLETDYSGQHAKSLEKSIGGKTTLSSSNIFSKVSQAKENDIKAESDSSDSSDTSVSLFSTTPSEGELSDDSSICGIKSCTEPEKSDGPLAAGNNDISMLEKISAVNDVDHNRPLSPKFASLVNSVDKSYRPKHTSPDLSSTNIEGTNGERNKVSSGFWGRALEPTESINDDSANKTELSKPASSLQFSFTLSGNSPLPLRVNSSKGKDMTLDEKNPADSGYNEPAVTDSLSKIISSNETKARKSVSSNSNCQNDNPIENGSKSDFCITNPRKLKPSSSPSLPQSPLSSSSSPLSSPLSSPFSPHVSDRGDPVKMCAAPLGSEKSKNATDNPRLEKTTNLFKHREIGPTSSNTATGHLSSGVGVNSISTRKSRELNDAQEIKNFSVNGPNGTKLSIWKVVDQLRGAKSSEYNSSEDGCGISGRYADKGLFPYELFVKLYNWNKVELLPCGLVNCGNSCYANAVLQCLAFTPPLTAYFHQGIHSKTCVRKEWCFTCEFEKLISKAKEGKSPLSPILILRNIQLGNGKEEDAHEFLRYAIDAMQSVCLSQAGVKASGSLEEETTLMGLTFGGYLRSKIKCMKCQGKSERQERMMDLTVEIDGDIGTLEEALRQFTGTEILDGENKYQCSRCKSYERAKKKLTILEASNVLTIALKRFQSGKFGKLSKPIKFPEILDLAPYMSGTSDKSPVYRLYGVIVHLDIMNAAFSGHYVCYVKNIQNKWFKIDDSTVTPVEVEKVLTKGAYMLLYSRCSPRAPRLIRNKIHPDTKTKGIPSRIIGKSNTSTPKSPTSDGLPNIAVFYSKFQGLQKILEEDSSDSSSLISTTSDEGSCSSATDSTRDSTSTDDTSDYIFGDSLHSPWRSSPDTSSFGSPETSRHTDFADGEGLLDRSPSQKDVGPFLHSDSSKQCRKLANSSSGRETDSSRLGWFNDVKSGLTYRKSSTRERTD